MKYQTKKWIVILCKSSKGNGGFPLMTNYPNHRQDWKIYQNLTQAYAAFAKLKEKINLDEQL